MTLSAGRLPSFQRRAQEAPSVSHPPDRLVVAAGEGCLSARSGLARHRAGPVPNEELLGEFARHRAGPVPNEELFGERLPKVQTRLGFRVGFGERVSRRWISRADRVLKDDRHGACPS